MGSSTSTLIAKDTPLFEKTTDIVRKILDNGSLELTTLSESLDGNAIYYAIKKNDVTGDDNYIFYSNLCCVTISIYSDSEIELDRFACSKGQSPPGFGKKLLCFSLKWLLNRLSLSKETKIKVYASPLGSRIQEDYEKLLSYYEKLGFSRGPPGDTRAMTSTVDIILQKCTQGGRRKKTRRRR